MLIETLNRIISTQSDLLHIVLPIAISFFTFEQIAYLVDTYRAKGRYHYRFIDYFLFVTFFPRLIAGPIIRHNEVLVQIRESFYYKINAQSLASGLSLFIMGLFKKLVISAYLAAQADILFQSTSNIGTLATWLGVLAFTLQIYFDFSSYSDMATGLAKMFGITLPMNFNSPYKALNVSEFWRRWNISLSRFLKDYLYIPVGAVEKGYLLRWSI